MPDPLDRFVQAQGPVIDTVLAELENGRKRTHWMWFVFPQLAGLGHSPTARHYALADRREAEAYLAHPTLGSRLRHCTTLVLAIPGKSVHDIFGAPDDLKFHSCTTLFAQIDEPAFQPALDRFFQGRPDPATLRLLQ